MSNGGPLTPTPKERFFQEVLEGKHRKGHNNPPSMVETAESVTRAINDWLTDHPVIEDELMARDAKVMIDRGKLCNKDLDDERITQVAPLNMEVQRINDLYRKPRELLRKITDEALRRVTDYLAKEEAKKIKIAEEARKKAAAAELAARDAERREQDTISDAIVGGVVDVGEAAREADAAYAEFQQSEREAARAEREARVKVGGGFTRSLSLRNREILTVTDPVAAVTAIWEMTGLPAELKLAIIKEARAYRTAHNKLPPGIESKMERSA